MLREAERRSKNSGWFWIRTFVVPFRRFKMLERLDQNDQDTVIKIIDAIIAKDRGKASLAPVDAAA